MPVNLCVSYVFWHRRIFILLVGYEVFMFSGFYQYCSAEHVDWAIECLPLGVKWPY
jgi:hypothetical protein